MPNIGETIASSSESQNASPEEQIATLKSGLTEDLRPIQDAVRSGDVAAVKKLYKRLISKYHQDKFEGSKKIKDAMQPINVAINSINDILKGDLPPDQQLAEVQNALETAEGLAGKSENPTEEAGPEITEGEIETEAGLINLELGEIGRECQATFDALQSAGMKMQGLQNLRASLEGLSPEFRNAHRQEIQKISESYAELSSRLTALDGRYRQTQADMSFFNHYRQEKTSLAEAPAYAVGLDNQMKDIRRQHESNAAEFARENTIAETLNRQMDKFQMQYQTLQVERANVARWQAHLDQQYYAIPPFDPQYQMKADENRRQIRQYYVQDAQLYRQMDDLQQTIQNLNQQQAQNTIKRQELWQEKLQLEARGNQLYQEQAMLYEDMARHQAAFPKAREKAAKIVRSRKQNRATPSPEAQA
ncbi:MAG: hypothetical protein WC551_00820 [Patescibacteria group bacterium]